MKKWPLLVLAALTAAPFVHAPSASADSEEPCYVFVFDAPGGAGTNPETLIAQVPCGDPGDLYAQVQMIALVEYKDDCRTLQIDAVSEASANAPAPDGGGPGEWGRWMALKMNKVATPDLAGVITWAEHVPTDDCQGIVSTTTSSSTPSTTSSTSEQTTSTTEEVTTTTTAASTTTSSTEAAPSTTTTVGASTTATDGIGVFNPTPVTDDQAHELAAAPTPALPSRDGKLPVTGSQILWGIALGAALALFGGMLHWTTRRPKAVTHR